MTAPVLAHKKFWIVKPSAGRNYVKNPQPYTSTGGYTASGDSTSIMVDSTHSRRGPACIKVIPATGVGSVVSYSAGLTGTSGLAYSFSVDVLGVAGQAMRIYATIGGVSEGTKTFTATGYWQRISLSFTAQNTGAVLLSLQRDSVASTSPFWTDGWQFEQTVYPSTFISGDMGDGYYWEGTRRDSASTRMKYVKTGGELLDLDDYCSVVSVTGLGHGDWNQIVTKMTSGGDLYQDHIRKSRQFSIVVDFTGDTLGEIEGKRKVLIDALRPDLFEGEMVVRYQGFAANGDEATHPVDIRCIPLPATLADTPDLPTHQREVLNFGIPSGLLDGAYEEGLELDLFAEFPAEYIVKRDPNGNWCKWNSASGEYYNPLYALNDSRINDIVEAPNGDIYVCGDFVNSGGVGATGVARWSKANQAWEAVGNPNAAGFRAMAFDAAGNLYAVGSGVNIAGLPNADYIAKYTVSTGQWSALNSGGFVSPIENKGIHAIAISPNTGKIYVGGNFSEIDGNTNCRNIAYYDGVSWHPLGTGLNDIVTALKFSPNGRLYIGGWFDSADGSNGDAICWWQDGAFHSFTDLGADEISGNVYTIEIDEHGRIYIGGSFYNAGGDPDADFIAQWNGNNWGKVGIKGADGIVVKLHHYAISREGNIYSMPKLYASGFFSKIGGIKASDKVAVYEGMAWKNLDIDLPSANYPDPGSVRAMLVTSDGTLYLGGTFSTTDSGKDAKSGIVAIDQITEIPNIDSTSSSANTCPRFEIYGGGKLLQITNYSTNKSIIFDDFTILDDERITIDFDPVNFVIKSSWRSRGNLLHYISAGSDYGNFYLKPGLNYLSLFFTDTSESAKAFITWTPKFWGLDGALL